MADAGFFIPKLLRARRKDKLPRNPEVLPIKVVFKPQRKIVMLKDVSGWVNNDKRTGKMWHFNTGKTYYVDDDVADQFIIKGYAHGETSRPFSQDEIDHIMSTITRIGLPEGV